MELPLTFRGKVVVITGASRGIGAACARSFAARGAQLVMIARTAAGPMLDTPGSLVQTGDLTDSAVRTRLIEETVSRFGKIDVLVNNAGVGLYANASGSSAEHTRYLFDLNTFVPLDLARLAAVHMRSRKQGVIINVGSVAGDVALPWSAVYSASKAGLHNLSDSLRREFASNGVHVAVVKPCIVNTRFRDHVLAGKPPEGVSNTRISVQPEDVAEKIVRAAEASSRAQTVPAWQFHPAVFLERYIPYLMDVYLRWKAR